MRTFRGRPQKGTPKMAVKEQTRRLKQKEKERMAKALFTTNLAWRVELVTPTPDLDRLLIEGAKQPTLVPKFVPQILRLRRSLKDGDPRLETPILYTYWGLKILENLTTAAERI